MGHGEVVKIRKALTLKWWLYTGAVVWRYMLLLALFSGGAGLFVYGCFISIDNDLARGGKVLGIATSSAGSGMVLARHVQKSIDRYSRCVLGIERILLNFDCDHSTQLRAAWGRATVVERREALRDKFWDYMNEVLKVIEEAMT